MKILAPEYQHTDTRRTLKQLFTADIKQVNIYDAKKGATLGNHYHKETTEFFYVVKGTVFYNKTSMINRGTTFVVYPPENHTLECMTDVTLMSFLDKPYDTKEPDIWKKES